jgi:hypothetical protein
LCKRETSIGRGYVVATLTSWLEVVYELQLLFSFVECPLEALSLAGNLLDLAEAELQLKKSFSYTRNLRMHLAVWRRT